MKQYFTDLLLETVVDLPPSLDEVVGCMLRAVGTGSQNNRVHSGHVLMLPGLDRTNEMDDLCVSSKSTTHMSTH